MSFHYLNFQWHVRSLKERIKMSQEIIEKINNILRFYYGYLRDFTVQETDYHTYVISWSFWMSAGKESLTHSPMFTSGKAEMECSDEFMNDNINKALEEIELKVMGTFSVGKTIADVLKNVKTNTKFVTLPPMETI